MKKKKQKKTDAAGKYTRPAAGPGGSGPGISSGPYGGAQQLPALQTIPFQPLQIQQEPMQPLPLAPGCERGASRGTKERTPADPAGKCGATFEQSENGQRARCPRRGQRPAARFRAGEMEPNGDKRRGFAVGAPARRSRDGNGKIAAPVGPMTGQRGFAAGEMEGE